MLKQKILFAFTLLLTLPAQAVAVNFYDGAKAPKGLYFLTYSSLYSADKTTDADAKTAKEDYGYLKIEELFRLCYYSPKLVLTAFIPFGYVHSGYYNASSKGIGDINLGAGYFLPVQQADILPMLFLKLPTGEYDSSKTVNYGTNQYDIKPVVFFYKALDRFSVDAAVKYHIRTENPGTKVSPGNELYLQLLLGWKLNDKCKVGPSINWLKSANQETNGTKISRSKRESLSLGADVYLRLPAFSLTLTYLRDIRSENTTQGDFFQVKTCYKF